MSYVDAVYDKKNDLVKVVERSNTGERIVKEYPAVYRFFFPHKDGEYKSIYGDPLRKFECQTATEFKKAVSSHSNKKLFESDLNPVFICLSENYLGIDAPKLNIAFWDIETDMQPYAYSSQFMVRIRKKI